MYFCSGKPMQFCSGVDSQGTCRNDQAAIHVRDGAIGFGKATAGTPDCAMNSSAAPEMANAAAKTTLTVIRIMRPQLRRLMLTASAKDNHEPT
jgi:hypothetical protein